MTRMRCVWVVSALVLSAALVWVALPERTQGPNVLIVVWDTVRRDHLSLYGHPKPTTPALEQWAKDAVVFENARSPAIWTLPAHASLFTGLPPPTTGADERWLWLDGAHETLAERFSARGYRTFSFAANALLSPETQLVQGFDVIMNTWRGKARAKAERLTKLKLLPSDRSNELSPGWKPPDHGAHNAEWARAVYKDAAPLIVDTFLRWVDERDDGRPFFAYLNLMEAHTPRIPSAASRSAVMSPELAELALATDAAHIRLHFYNFGQQEYTDAEIDAIRGVYDAALRDLDTATQALISGLSDRDKLNDTIVVLTSDHGENLGDHHLFNHRFALWDSLLRVPLVIRYPAALPAGRVAEPVSTLDLFATLVALCGLGDAPPSSQSLVNRDTPRGPVVSWMASPLAREIETVKAVHPDVAVEPWIRSGEAVAVGSRVFIRYSTGEASAYDLEVDPGQLAPLPPESSLAAALNQALAAVIPYDPTRRGPKDRPGHTRASGTDFQDALQALGYTTPEPAELPLNPGI